MRKKRKEEFKKKLLSLKPLIKDGNLKFTQLASLLRLCGFNVSDVQVARWCKDLHNERFDHMKLIILKKTYRYFSENPPYKKPKPYSKEETSGVHIDPKDGNSLTDLLPACFPFPPLPNVVIRFLYMNQNLGAPVEEDVSTRAKRLLRWMENRNHTGDIGS